jgi:hypothetical protein
MAKPVDVVKESGRSKSYICFAAWLTFAGGITWALLGSWLTANEITDASTEFQGYTFSFLLVLFGGFIYFLYEPRWTVLSKAVTVTGTVLGLLIVIKTCKYSDDTFIFWKMRAVKPATWNQMVADLRSLDGKWREFDPHVPHFIPREQAPRSFDALALPQDWTGVHNGAGDHPIMVCGVKSRRWGLVLGSTNFFYGSWARFKRVEVGDDAWFFAGPGD